MIVAGAAAVVFICAGGHHRAENTVLHVEHWHVLVHDDFQPRWWGCVDQVEKLVAIQVVRRGDSFGSLVYQKLSGQVVGNVEREIGDDPNACGEVVTQTREVSGPGFRRHRVSEWL